MTTRTATLVDNGVLVMGYAGMRAAAALACRAVLPFSSALASLLALEVRDPQTRVAPMHPSVHKGFTLHSTG